MLLRDITASVIPFSTIEYNVAITLIFLLVMAALIDFVLVFALVKQVSIPIDSQIILSLVFADLCFALAMLGFVGTNGRISIARLINLRF